MSSTIYLSDSSVYSEREDKFNRYNFAKRVASIASSKSKETIVIGLYGKWGEGKTSVLNFIEKELESDTILIKFNPWMFKDDETLLLNFLNVYANGLGKKLKSTKEKIGELISNYGSLLTFGYTKGAFQASIGALESLNNLFGKDTLEDSKQRINNFILKSNKRIVVTIDDIDRLDKSEILMIFKLVKLVGDFCNTTYILAFDNEVVSSILNSNYNSIEQDKDGYLDKIIQIPLFIPKATNESLRVRTLDLISNVLENNKIELSSEEKISFFEMFDEIFVPLIKTPRLSVRYCNSIASILPLLKIEVNTVDLLLILGVEFIFPKLYIHIRNNQSLYCKYDDNEKSEFNAFRYNEISKILAKLDENESKLATKFLVKIFPQLSYLNSNRISFPDKYFEKWIKEKRICSSKYIERYFTYSVNKGEISIQIFENLINSLETDSVDKSCVLIKEIITNSTPFNFLQLMRLREESLTQYQCKILLTSIYNLCDFFPEERGMLIASSYTQSIRMIIRLLDKQKEQDKFKTAENLITNAKSIEYATDLIYWLGVKDIYSVKDEIFSKTDLIRLKKIILIKAKGYFDKDNFFSIFSNGDLRNLFSIWIDVGEVESLKIFLNKNLNDKTFILKLIKSIVPFITELTSFQSYHSDFKYEDFKILTEIIDIEKLYKSVLKSFGKVVLSSEEIHQLDDFRSKKLSDLEIIYLFQKYYAEYKTNNFS